MAKAAVAIAMAGALAGAALGHSPWAAAALTVDQVFNQREVYGPSFFTGAGADVIVFGAIEVVPNGAASRTGTFEQNGAQGAMQFNPVSGNQANLNPSYPLAAISAQIFRYRAIPPA